jgi:hypothetical protein
LKYNIERQIKTSFGKQFPWVKVLILLSNTLKPYTSLT